MKQFVNFTFLSISGYRHQTCSLLFQQYEVIKFIIGPKPATYRLCSLVQFPQLFVVFLSAPHITHFASRSCNDVWYCIPVLFQVWLNIHLQIIRRRVCAVAVKAQSQLSFTLQTRLGIDVTTQQCRHRSAKWFFFNFSRTFF